MTHLNNIYLIGKIIKIMHLFYVVNFSFTFCEAYFVILQFGDIFSSHICYSQVTAAVSSLFSPPNLPIHSSFPYRRGQTERCQPNRAHQIVIRLRIVPHINVGQGNPKEQKGSQKQTKVSGTDSSPTVTSPTKRSYTTVTYT